MNTQLFTTITGIILTIAAILAYLLQRARYLREIEPDLEITWLNRIDEIEVETTLDQRWSMYIPLQVVNKSENHAQDIMSYVDLKLFPDRRKPQYIHPKYFPWPHGSQLLAGRSKEILVYVGSNFAPDLYDELRKESELINIEQVGFFTTISIEYYSSREFLLFLMLPPWNLGRKKYKRDIILRYYLDKEIKNDKALYSPRVWKYPEEQLRQFPVSYH
jgi:hypothetical protein